MSFYVAAKRRGETHPVDEVLPAGKLAVYGAQHVLAFYAGAVIVRSVAGIPQANVSVPGAAFVLGGLLALLLVPVLRRLRLAEAIA